MTPLLAPSLSAAGPCFGQPVRRRGKLVGKTRGESLFCASFASPSASHTSLLAEVARPDLVSAVWTPSQAVPDTSLKNIGILFDSWKVIL